ncbi:MAG: alkane 1-monooxygenase [Terrimonas sp.]|nr:alkane 1-monooxygenase [Terrimonas sp.]
MVMKWRAFKYLSPFIIYAGAFYSFHTRGWMIWLPMIYAWIIIPFVELFIRPNPANLDEAEEAIAKKDWFYDLIIYLTVPLQFIALFFFLSSMRDTAISPFEVTGRIAVMGLLCGVFGINVGHELGHRVNKAEQAMAKLLLMTSLYMHFFIEHNKGHHKRVATPEDPSSARLGEMLYAFYGRSIFFSYRSAWQIANREMRKKGKHILSLHNEMIQFHMIQALFVAIIYFSFGGLITLYFLAAALMGILLLETVNYIEHYGLQREKGQEGKYGRALPEHSWNSDHVIGRLMLFELSRHSDHHYLASRKYQVLRHHDDAPQMPTGYPGMMLLSLIPPLWFLIMNKRIRQLHYSPSGL